MIDAPHWPNSLAKRFCGPGVVALLSGLVIPFSPSVGAQIRGPAPRGALTIYTDASKPPYNARADGSDATPAINAAINAAYAAGGGVVYLPAGTYTIQGHGLPSDGAIVLKSNTCLMGAGKGVTILKLKDDMDSDITGLVRTPTATATSNVCLKSLTIDGNKAHNASVTIIGFFCGVNPSASITGISVSGTVATVTTTPDGPNVTAGMTVSIFNTRQPALSGDFVVQTVPTKTTFTITVAAGAASETSSPPYIWYYPTSLANAYVSDVLIDGVEIQNCSDYGFDPHERTKRLTIRDSTSHDNDKDGFVADYIESGVYANDQAYNNGRHGFNITTGTNNFALLNCASGNNGVVSNGSGLTIQRGSSYFPFPSQITVTGGDYHHNSRDGILLQMASQITVSGATIHDNQWSGIHLTGGQYSAIIGNLVKDNSQIGNNSKSEIKIEEYDDSAGASGQRYGSIWNLVDGNNIQSTVADARAKYSIEEAADASGNNRITSNSVNGAATGPHFVGSSTTIVNNFSAASGVQSLSSTVTWSGGTPPSGTNQSSYSWQKFGQMVTAQIRLDYSVAGVSLTGVDIDFPPDMPLPQDMMNVSNQSMITACNAVFSTNMTNNTSSTRCILVKDRTSATGYKLRIFGSAGNHTGAVIQASYIAINSR